MPNQNHVKLLKQGYKIWNEWRSKNIGTTPDLSNADLREDNLRMSNLSNADLRGANLRESNLRMAILVGADLSGADLGETNLRKADFCDAILDDANLRRSRPSSAKFRKAKLQRANLRGACITKADFSEANLIEADLTKATLVETIFTGAFITAVRLYGTSRDDWVIYGVKCDCVYLDREGEERTPIDRDFKPGEFEERYKQLPTVNYVFDQNITPFDLVVMGNVVDEINQQNPEYNLVFDSHQSRGEYQAVFSIQDKGYSEAVKDSITRKYEKHIASLKGQRKALMSVISDFTARQGRVKLIAGGDITMGDQVKTTGQTGDAFIAKDQATVNINKIINPAAKDLIEQIGKLILSDDVQEDDKADAQQQLSNMAKELEKAQPEKGRLKRFYDRMIDVVPKIAEKLPWGKIVEQLMLG